MPVLGGKGGLLLLELFAAGRGQEAAPTARAGRGRCSLPGRGSELGSCPGGFGGAGGHSTDSELRSASNAAPQASQKGGSLLYKALRLNSPPSAPQNTRGWRSENGTKSSRKAQHRRRQRFHSEINISEQESPRGNQTTPLQTSPVPAQTPFPPSPHLFGV